MLIVFSANINVVNDFSLPWYAILGISVGVPVIVFVIALYCIKFGYKWRSIYVDAKKTAKQELTIDVSQTGDKESDIYIVSSKTSYSELAKEIMEKSEPTTEILDGSSGFLKEECSQKSAMAVRGYVQFGLLPETTCINPKDPIEPPASIPEGEIPCSGYVPIEGILKQQNNRHGNENKQGRNKHINGEDNFM